MHIRPLLDLLDIKTTYIIMLLFVVVGGGDGGGGGGACVCVCVCNRFFETDPSNIWLTT